MRLRYLLRPLPFLLFSAGLAMGQTTAPATQPAAVDQATPRGALKLFFSADASSDGPTIRGLLLANGPAQEHVIAGMADQKSADRALTDALRARFPDEWKVDPRQARREQLPAMYDKIDQADQKIDGDTATLTARDANAPPFTLKCVDGRWRIPLEVLVRPIEPDKMEQGAHQIDIQVKVMQSAARDVAAGKYATQTAAIEDIKKRMFDAAVADHAATQPVTRP